MAHRELNQLGVWLCEQLGRRGIKHGEFAAQLGIDKHRLSNIIHRDFERESYLWVWKGKFVAALEQLDRR